MKPHPDLRLGIWVDEVNVSKYDRELISWARTQKGLVLSALLTSRPSAAGRPSAAARVLLGAVTAIEEVLLRRQSARHANHRERTDARKALGGARVPIIPASDTEQLSRLDLDLIVFLGAELPDEAIPVTSRLGWIAFESADPTHRCGVPPGFREAFERRDTTRFAVKHYTKPGQAGEVLLRGDVPTRHYYLLNQAALHAKSYHYLRSLITAAASTGTLPAPTVTSPSSSRPAGFPSAAQILLYAGRFASGIVSRLLGRIARREEVWQVGYLRCDWRKAALWKGVSIENPPGRYLADPFVISREGRDYCFVEDYDRAQQRACISVYELGATRAERLGTVIDEPFHLSFPYLFEHDGALFMCPESYENSDIRIYRCVDFPMKWTLEKIVMSGIKAADTMMFERDGKWWLLTTLDPGETGEIASELFVFSADSPLDPIWKPHPMNPVRFDAACGRNAGLLVDGKKVFRVSQRRGFARYGKNSQINEILELTENTYEERCIGTIEPAFQDALLGTHHLHGTHSMTVFDFLTVAPAGHSPSWAKDSAARWPQRRVRPVGSVGR